MVIDDQFIPPACHIGPSLWFPWVSITSNFLLSYATYSSMLSSSQLPKKKKRKGSVHAPGPWACSQWMLFIYLFIFFDWAIYLFLNTKQMYLMFFSNVCPQFKKKNRKYIFLIYDLLSLINFLFHTII